MQKNITIYSSIFLICNSLIILSSNYINPKFTILFIILLTVFEILINIILSFIIAQIIEKQVLLHYDKCIMLPQNYFVKFSDNLASIIVIIAFILKNISIINSSNIYLIFQLQSILSTFALLKLILSFNKVYLGNNFIWISKYQNHINIADIKSININSLKADICKIKIDSSTQSFSFNATKNSADKLQETIKYQV